MVRSPPVAGYRRGIATTVHRYRSSLTWQGSTAESYDHYTRSHSATTDPSTTALALSADPSFRGDPADLNPEQLLVLATSSCQLLSFLAVAARARLDVVDYTDAAEAEMPEGHGPISITRITLRPTITLRSAPSERPSDDRLAHLVAVAHAQCFIANSLRSDIVIEPSFVFVEGPDSA